MSIPESSREDAYAVLTKESPAERPLTVSRMALRERKPYREAPKYLAALKSALWEEPLPFGTGLYCDMYRTALASPQWVAMSLIANAGREGDDARYLWSAAVTVVSQKERQFFKNKAVAKSTNALAYLQLLDLLFPKALAPEFRSQLNSLSPGYSTQQRLPSPARTSHVKPICIGNYIQLNVAEIRATIHRLMQHSALSEYCPLDHLQKAAVILDQLFRHGLDYIGHSAVFIERKADDIGPDDLRKQFCKQLREFNRRTSEEAIEYSYNQRFGNYP